MKANFYNQRQVSRLAALLVGLCFLIPVAAGQNSWSSSQIDDVFSGGKVDIKAGLALIATAETTAYDFGMDLLAAEHFSLAIAWYEAMAIDTGEFLYVYGRAYSRWEKGDNDNALQDALYLSDQKLTPLLEARTYYLLGNISEDSGLFELADKYFTNSFDIYKRIGKQGGVRNSLIKKALCAIYLGRYKDVLSLLKRSQVAENKNVENGYKPVGMGPHYSILGDMHFWKREYEKAFKYNKMAQQEFQKSNFSDAANSCLVKLGIINFLLKKPRAAYEIVEELNNNHPQERNLAYLNVLLAKISQCGQDEAYSQARYNAAMEWANDRPGGGKLTHLAEFLMNQPCPKLEED